MGYFLQKSQIHNPRSKSSGGYRITDAATNYVIAGYKYELSIDEVSEFIEGHLEEMVSEIWKVVKI